MFVKIFFRLIAEKQLTKLARLLTYQEKLLLRQHTLMAPNTLMYSVKIDRYLRSLKLRKSLF